jgi:hypothetical protein
MSNKELHKLSTCNNPLYKKMVTNDMQFVFFVPKSKHIQTNVSGRSVLDYSIAINQLDEKDKTSMVLTGSSLDGFFCLNIFIFIFVVSTS